MFVFIASKISLLANINSRLARGEGWGVLGVVVHFVRKLNWCVFVKHTVCRVLKQRWTIAIHVPGATVVPHAPGYKNVEVRNQSKRHQGRKDSHGKHKPSFSCLSGLWYGSPSSDNNTPFCFQLLWPPLWTCLNLLTWEFNITAAFLCYGCFNSVFLCYVEFLLTNSLWLVLHFIRGTPFVIYFEF